MTALTNTVTLLNNYWSTIVIIIALVILTIEEIKKYKNMTREQRIEAALTVVKKEVLKFMSDAEIEWEEYKKSGELKKSQVITEIYEKFPALKEYVDQDELIEKIEVTIDAEMENMNKIINNETTEETES